MIRRIRFLGGWYLMDDKYADRLFLNENRPDAHVYLKDDEEDAYQSACKLDRKFFPNADFVAW